MQSFKKIGLIDNIGILLPDNTFRTRLGVLNVSEHISFEEEVNKQEWISGHVKDITNPVREVIRAAVPVTVDGETVGILYGITEFSTINERFREEVEDLNADLFVIEGRSGNMVIDSLHSAPQKITSLASLTFDDGYTYEKLVKDITNGNSGYSAFYSTTYKEILYAHYSPIGISDWVIMLTRQESAVFEGAIRTGRYLVIMFTAIIIIMTAYLFIALRWSKKKSDVFVYASLIRKRLLGAWNKNDSIKEALKAVSEFSVSRSAFFSDSMGDFYLYIRPEEAENEVKVDDKSFMVQQLIAYGSSRKKEYGTSVQIIGLKADEHLKAEAPALYSFLKDNGIRKIDYALIVSGAAQTAVLGIINADNKMTGELLREIAVFLSMSVYNIKYLINTETMALTDSLTGISNRMAYKQDIKNLIQESDKPLACIYADVNELHYFNNKYGHAAGDQMLVYIAETLKSEFREGKVYRMGGDEFLIFIGGIAPGILEKRIGEAKREIEEMKYHISVGLRFLDKDMNVEELVNEAEKLMNEDKADYYRERSLLRIADEKVNNDIEHLSTGNKAVDACLTVMSMRYQGIYSVNIRTDKAIQILSPYDGCREK